MVLFTDTKGQIIGFAVTAPYYQSFWSKLTKQAEPTLYWRGAVNTSSLHSNAKIEVWAASDENHLIVKLGETKV